MTTTFKLKYKFVFFFWPFTLSADISEKKITQKKNKNKMAARECRLLKLLCDLFIYLFMYFCQDYEETIKARNLKFCIDDPSVV